MMENILNQVIELFKQKYQPASDISQATDFLDTEEIFSAIEKIAPGSGIKKEDLFSILQSEGYIFNAEPDKFSFSLKWMLCRKF